MAGIDLNQISTNDRGVVLAGIVAFVTSFMPYVGADLGMIGAVTVNAWHGLAILGLLLVFVAAGLVAVRVFSTASMPQLRVGWSLITTACAGLGTLVLLLQTAIAGTGISVQWGGYLLLLAGIAETIFAVLGFRASGEKLPWQQ